MILWRISNFATLNGEGGKLFPGRWHSAGQSVAYASDHPASSLCEMLVHFDSADLPVTFQVLKINTNSALVSETPQLTDHWIENLAHTRGIGDEWLEANTSALLRVPSAIVPVASNYLINPNHDDMMHIAIEQIIKVPLDPRLR